MSYVFALLGFTISIISQHNKDSDMALYAISAMLLAIFSAIKEEKK